MYSPYFTKYKHNNTAYSHQILLTFYVFALAHKIEIKKRYVRQKIANYNFSNNNNYIVIKFCHGIFLFLVFF